MIAFIAIFTVAALALAVWIAVRGWRDAASPDERRDALWAAATAFATIEALVVVCGLIIGNAPQIVAFMDDFGGRLRVMSAGHQGI